MYFEANLKGQIYKIDVLETKDFWELSLRSDSDEGKGMRERHHIAKKDYMELDGAVSFLFNDSSYMVDVLGSGLNYTVYTRGYFQEIEIYNDEALLHESLKGSGGMSGGNSIIAGMPGKIVKVFVQPGDEVDIKAPLLVMEAMKMENEIRSTAKVKIKDVLVQPGQSVEAGATLVTFE